MSWEKSKYSKCPKCGQMVEEYIHDGYDCAERCPHCKWQINFNPDVKKVSYGTIVNIITEDY